MLKISKWKSSVIVIIQLMLSLLVWPKVTTFSGFYCISISSLINLIKSIVGKPKLYDAWTSNQNTPLNYWRLEVCNKHFLWLATTWLQKFNNEIFVGARWFFSSLIQKFHSHFLRLMFWAVLKLSLRCRGTDNKNRTTVKPELTTTFE